jgi:hypothetical protein
VRELDGEAMRRSLAFDARWTFAWYEITKWRRLKDEPCPVCGGAEMCRTNHKAIGEASERRLVYCVAVASERGATGGWIHVLAKKGRRAGRAAA